MTRNGVDFNSILDNERERNASDMTSDGQNSCLGPVSPKDADNRGAKRKKSVSFRSLMDPSANMMQKF